MGRKSRTAGKKKPTAAQTSNGCYVEHMDGLVLLRRKLPSGRVISIDTCNNDMLTGGYGIAHLDMNNANNIPSNLNWVNESEARALLLNFTEDSESVHTT